MSDPDPPKPKNRTKENAISILLYALAIAAALSLNDLILTIFTKFKWTREGGEIISKAIYVIVMFIAVLSLANFTGARVPI